MIFRLLCFAIALAGCEARPILTTIPSNTVAKLATPAPDQVKLADAPVPVSRVAVGQNIWLETVITPELALANVVSEGLSAIGGQMALGNSMPASFPRKPAVAWINRTSGIQRRVILDLEVVLNKGFLEHLISRSEAAKDHESVLSSHFDAEMLHTALLGAGLRPGKPAKFINENREYDFKPATGDPIRILLEYQGTDGKLQVVKAQSWAVNAKTGKPLDGDWVYAGSVKGKSTNGAGEEYVYFGANDGRVVCLTNFSTALLDLPFESVDSDPNGDSLGYKANTELIPERGTRVRAIFEAIPKVK